MMVGRCQPPAACGGARQAAASVMSSPLPFFDVSSSHAGRFSATQSGPRWSRYSFSLASDHQKRAVIGERVRITIGCQQDEIGAGRLREEIDPKLDTAVGIAVAQRFGPVDRQIGAPAQRTPRRAGAGERQDIAIAKLEVERKAVAHRTGKQCAAIERRRFARDLVGGRARLRLFGTRGIGLEIAKNLLPPFGDQPLRQACREPANFRLGLAFARREPSGEQLSRGLDRQCRAFLATRMQRIAVPVGRRQNDGTGAVDRRDLAGVLVRGVRGDV